MTTPVSDDTPTPEWWDEIRGGVAFLVAPAMVPLYFCMTPTSPGFEGVDAFILMAASFFSYIATFVVGVPTYLMLRAWNLTAFWFAPAIGLVVGAGLGSLLPIGGFLRGAQSFGAVAGALVAMVLWTIGRPDLPARPPYQGEQHSPRRRASTP
jgi:hypothetical protein